MIAKKSHSKSENANVNFSCTTYLSPLCINIMTTVLHGYITPFPTGSVSHAVVKSAVQYPFATFWALGSPWACTCFHLHQ